MAKKSFNPILLVLGLLILAGIGFTAMLVTQRGSNLKPFPVAEYRNNPLALEGKSYALDAKVKSKLGFREGVGFILTVEPIRQKSEVAVYLPVGMISSPDADQRYLMDVEVRQGGLIHVLKIESN